MNIFEHASNYKTKNATQISVVVQRVRYGLQSIQLNSNYKILIFNKIQNKIYVIIVEE